MAHGNDDSSDNNENFANAIGFVHLPSTIRLFVLVLFHLLPLSHSLLPALPLLLLGWCTTKRGRVEIARPPARKLVFQSWKFSPSVFRALFKKKMKIRGLKNNDLHFIAIMNVQSWFGFSWLNVCWRVLFFSFSKPSVLISPFFLVLFLFSTTACLVSFATETVMQLCHGRRRCTISADTQTFGNPCRPDSRMYLKTVYTCGECCCVFCVLNAFFALSRLANEKVYNKIIIVSFGD